MAKQTFTTGQVLTAAQMTSLQQTAMGGGSTTAKTTSYVLVAADAGTTVAMNAAGSTTITVNTSLFSAGDSVFIQNWGAGTCTVTAGTATVTTHGSLALSQWEGGTLYFTSSSAAIFFDISQSAGMTNPMTTTGDTIYSSSGSTPARLGIGSTGQVLTVAAGVPSWATPAGGGSGLTFIAGATFTSSTAINVNDCFSTTYKNYFIIGAVTAASTDLNLNMRMRVSGADNTTADYDRNNITTNATNLSGGNSLNQSSWIEIITCFGSNTGTNFKIEIFNPFATEYTSARCNAVSFKSNNDLLGVVGMTKEQTTSFTGFSLIPTAGNVTGFYRVYGLADA